jgi:membrane protein
MMDIMPVIKRLTDFLKTGIWRLRLSEFGPLTSTGVRLLRMILLAVRGFHEDHLPLRASALTLYTLFSLVPVLAMAFGIAKGFGFEAVLEKRLLENFPGQEDIINHLMGYAVSLLQSTKGGLIAGIGVAVLFWTVIKVLEHIENSLNDIWGITASRSLARKFSDYLAVMLIGPLLLIMSGSATVFITTQITSIMEKVSLLGLISPLIYFLLKLLPYGLIWILFTLLYTLLPNTRVRLGSGLMAGIFAGTCYQIAQWIYINFQVGAARYNAIYGGFAALPLFLAWLQISWIIVLIGAEISFAHQNADAFEFEKDSHNISLLHKKRIALCISHQLIQNFAAGTSPFTAIALSRKLEIPIRLVRQILQELVESNIFSITGVENDEEPAYQPAKDIHQLTILNILNALDARGSHNIHVRETPALETISEALHSFAVQIEKAPLNKRLMDI